jgi:predicted ATP-binding protein involved in virulence
MITKLELNNFTTFEKLDIDFSPRINVIIGENGTGKTQLLKAAYTLASTSSQNSAVTDPKELEKIFTDKFTRIFMPDDLKIGRLARCQESLCATVQGDFLENGRFEKKIKFDFSTRVQSLKIDEKYKSQGDLYAMSPIFIPTKEVISLYRGLLNEPSHKDVFQNIFDDSYFDLCNKLSQTPSEENEPRIQAFLEDIVNKIQGRFEFEGSSVNFNAGQYIPYAQSTIEKDKTKDGKRFFEPTPDEKLSTHMVAEGFRKLGVLHRLIENQSLVPKKSGSLFWDEPESNMNPKLMKLIVQLLLELSKKEQQIIITTHDYVLLKWFDVLDKTDTHVRYHVLSRDHDGKIIKHSTDDYLDIFPNPIDDAYSNLLDTEIEKDLGL